MEFYPEGVDCFVAVCEGVIFFANFFKAEEALADFATELLAKSMLETSSLRMFFVTLTLAVKISLFSLLRKATWVSAGTLAVKSSRSRTSQSCGTEISKPSPE